MWYQKEDFCDGDRFPAFHAFRFDLFDSLDHSTVVQKIIIMVDPEFAGGFNYVNLIGPIFDSMRKGKEMNWSQGKNALQMIKKKKFKMRDARNYFKRGRILIIAYPVS